ncbi:hypothetical protein VUJ46_19105 [Chryseobacterium sp. MYb264]|uniref:hypothetical protein n=1 Tax=Chryseobacterium sp. MYb264 TaxID=2745153 RepID=UPI002E0E0281|nr:hypothetical protein VUJ46_19105 [Chryseobacterium sp. MYb264]
MKIYDTSKYILLFLGTLHYAQVGIGTSSPSPSAILEVSSANKGFLLPRLNLTGRNDVITIANPANGLMVVNLTANGSGSNAVVGNSIYFWQSSAWQKFTTFSEITVYKQSNQYVMRSTTAQSFTAAQVTGVNNSQNYEVPILWSANEISIDNPADIELASTNDIFTIKTAGNYRLLSNYSFNPQRSVTADNSNYTYVAITVMKSTNNGSTWTAVAGSATPYDIGVSNQLQTVILPRTILRFNANDRIKIVITKPGTATPSYGSNAGILKKATEDYTKYLRITRLNNNN